MKNRYTRKRAGLLALGLLLVILIGIESNLIHRKNQILDRRANEETMLASNSDKKAEDPQNNSERDSEKLLESQTNTESETESLKDNSAESGNGNEGDRETEKETVPEFKESKSMEDLKKELKDLKASYEEDFSILVLNPDSDEMLSLWDGKPKKAANLMNLFVMETVYNQIKEGEMKETKKVQKLLSGMISENEDESCNSLVELLSPDGKDFEAGMEIVNQYIQSQGYTGTSMGRALMAGKKSENAGENYTTVLDCGTLIYKIFQRSCVDKESSEKMYDLLSAQEVIDKIPEGVGAAVPVANKTGESADVESDAALVEIYKGANYILCVIGNDVKDSEKAVSEIAEISSLVYEYFDSNKE